MSLDFELIWGTLDRPYWRRMKALCESEREEVVGALLELFHSRRISATWCTVGHLFLDRCSDVRGVRHPELVRGEETALNRDPCTSEQADPIFYGLELIRRIQRCPTPQEIGSHSFSHTDFSRCSREAAESELAACVATAADLGLRLTSFAFPRNRIGHLDVLARNGIAVFRGADKVWYELAPRRRWYHRLGHLADIALAAAPPLVMPEADPTGMWNVPGSMLYTPSHGARRYIPVQNRVTRAAKGLDGAARQRRIFHLWFHPTDLVVRRKAMMEGLARILDKACVLRETGKLAILPMREIPGFAGLASRTESPTAEVAAR